jgi:uncharacterized protein (TIGR03083 family)
MDTRGHLAEERRALADFLDTLDDEAWNTPSLCEGWTVKDVVGHLTMPFNVSLPKLIVKMAGAGFNFDKANDKLSRQRGATIAPRDLAANLRANAEHPFTPPGAGPEAPLSDTVIHGGDIRRPLHAPHVVAEERARIVLGMLTSGKARGFVGKGRLDGLRFEATDVDWTSGTGALVRGPAEALIMAISGRAAAFADLDGDGVAVLRSRR